MSLLWKRQRKSGRGQVIRVHFSPSGMLSKVLNKNLAHNVLPDTNDMHATMLGEGNLPGKIKVYELKFNRPS